MSIMDRLKGQENRDRYKRSEGSGLLLPRDEVMAEALEEDRAREQRREQRRSTKLQETANTVMATVGKATLLRLYDEHLSAGGPEGADAFMEVLAFMVERLESAGALTERLKEAKRRAKPAPDAPKAQGPLDDVLGVDMDEIMAIAEGRVYTGGVEEESALILPGEGGGHELSADDPLFELMEDFR